ncbi:hypothetical protein ACFLWE_01160 [Chloroflexota bacterium]
MQKSVSNTDLISDIKNIASKLGRRDLSRSEYLQYGRFSAYDIYDGGRTWEELCNAAGVITKKIAAVPDEVYFERLQMAIEKLGRYPKTAERKMFGLNFSKRRYPTLRAFLEEAIRLGKIPSLLESPLKIEQTTVGISKVPANTTPESPITTETPPIPILTKRIKWERIGIDGFPYSPHDELGVVCIFGILCSQGYINWQILELSGGKGIDGTCYDNTARKEIRVELKHTLSRGSWNHPIEDIDYVVCWKNRWPDFPKPVVELSGLVLKLTK